MRFLGTYLLYGENELLEVGAQSESIRFSGSPRRNGPAAPSNLSPVHKSCPTPTLKVLPHNHLPVSSLANGERQSERGEVQSVKEGLKSLVIAEERFKSLPSVPKPD